jgi:hypothetical protein
LIDYCLIFSNKKKLIQTYKYLFIFNQNFLYGDWGLGMGDWGLGIGDWAQSPIPNPQSPIPNPQSPLNFNKIKK